MTQENNIKDVAVSPDGARLCMLGYDSIAVLRLADKQLIASAAYRYGGTQFVATWSPDGEEIATVQKDSFVFYVADTMETRRTIEMQYASDVSYAPDGTMMALGSWNSGVLIERSPTIRSTRSRLKRAPG